MKYIDIEGKKFGKLVVIEYTNIKNNCGRNMWKCKCDCGKEILTISGQLRNGHKTSCGCSHPHKFQDLTGKKYGKLTVIGFDGIIKRKTFSKYMWKCKCDCGNITKTTGHSLKSGNTLSCGCLLKRSNKDNPIYKGYEEISSSIFNVIIRRSKYNKMACNISIKYIWDLFIKQNRKCALSGLDLRFPKNYNDYGNASLDRIDSDEGYIIGNVQWVHKDINQMKSNHKEHYFIDLCKKVAENKNF